MVRKQVLHRSLGATCTVTTIHSLTSRTSSSPSPDHTPDFWIIPFLSRLHQHRTFTRWRRLSSTWGDSQDGGRDGKYRLACLACGQRCTEKLPVVRPCPVRAQSWCWALYNFGAGKLNSYCAGSLNDSGLQIWADPATYRTVRQGGLPPGRGVKVYGFAPP